jgi:hypothetical protein
MNLIWDKIDQMYGILKIQPVQWLPSTWEAIVGGLLEPGSFRPAWATQQDLFLKNKTEQKAIFIYLPMYK